MSGQTVSLTVDELKNTYGILFTGYVLGMVSYGFTFFQTYDYYSQYSLDHWIIKATVGSLCILDTINSVLISHALYHYLILTFPDTPPLLHITPTYCAEIGVSALAILIVQIYYSHRVWMASRNAAVAGGIAVISLAAFALGIAATGNLAKSLVFSSLTTPQAKGITASSQGLTFLSGVSVFAALSFYLNPLQDPMLELSERLYNNIATYTITRGGLATIFQFGYFVTFILAPTKPFWMPFHLVASKASINSLLAMLNARKVHQGKGMNEEDTASRKTDTTSSSSVSRLSSNIRFAARQSKLGINAQVNKMDDIGTTVLTRRESQ